MKVKIATRNCFYYPDLVLTCDNRDRDTDYFKQYPKLIIEVLSDTTEAFDRGAKFRDYGELDSLEEYVSISQYEPLIESFKRVADGGWYLDHYQQQDDWHVQCLDWIASLDVVYEDIF